MQILRFDMCILLLGIGARLCAQDSGHTMDRAGHPNQVSILARPSANRAYVGYFVGGGSPCRGSDLLAHQGTWGWDYQGWVWPRWIVLNWNQRFQGGTGAYRTDGPATQRK